MSCVILFLASRSRRSSADLALSGLARKNADTKLFTMWFLLIRSTLLRHWNGMEWKGVSTHSLICSTHPPKMDSHLDKKKRCSSIVSSSQHSKCACMAGGCSSGTASEGGGGGGGDGGGGSAISSPHTIMENLLQNRNEMVSPKEMID